MSTIEKEEKEPPCKFCGAQPPKGFVCSCEVLDDLKKTANTDKN